MSCGTRGVELVPIRKELMFTIPCSSRSKDQSCVEGLTFIGPSLMLKQYSAFAAGLGNLQLIVNIL